MAYWLALASATGQRIWTALRRPKAHIVTGTGALTLGGLRAQARGRVRSGPNASIEERVVLLERLIDSAEDRLDRAEDELQRETEQRVEAITSERQAREANEQSVNERLENLAVGGLRLQMVGLLWLFFGITLATWSKEIADLLTY